MSQPDFIEIIKNQIDDYIKCSNFENDEKIIIQLLTNLLDYFFLAIKKIEKEEEIAKENEDKFYSINDNNSDKNNIIEVPKESNNIIINLENKILSKKSEILELLEKTHTKEEFHILNIESFDNSLEYISTLINNFFYYFSVYKIQKELIHIYYYIFHLIYYILFSIIKNHSKNLLKEKIFKFYLFHIVHFFQDDKKSPELNYFFYEGAFKYFKKNMDIYVRYIFELNSDIINVLLSCHNIEVILNNFYLKLLNKKIKTEDEYNFLGSYKSIMNEINTEINKIKENYNNKIVELISNQEKSETTLLILCQMIKDQSASAIKILKNKNITCESLENFLNKMKELSRIIFTQNLSINHFALMKYNYKKSASNEEGINKYFTYLKEWQNDNKKTNQDNTIIFSDLIESKDFKQLFLSAMNSSYIKGFVEYNKLSSVYKEFMDNYADIIDKYILYVPLTKGIKAYVSNYFRIALNINSIELIGTFQDQSRNEILKSYLLINLLHESFHFLFRLNKKGYVALEALSPKVQKISESYQEIGVDLILYIFGTEYIVFITPEQSNLISDIESWTKTTTNFKVFEKVYYSEGELVKNETSKKIKGLKCNISINEENKKNWNICKNGAIKYCF